MEPSTTKPARERAGVLLELPEHRRQQEPAEAARRADEPVTTPICSRKRCGTSWNTAPLPSPRQTIAVTSTATIGASGGTRAAASVHARSPSEQHRQQAHAADAVGQ